MQAFDTPFAFLLLGWSAGFASSVVLHYVALYFFSFRNVGRHWSGEA